ncbi:hypothetical protein [Staphylococcus hominis]
MEHNSKEYYELQSDFWFNECCKRMKESDELINDMADIKRKAEAFDEILEIAEEDCWAEEFAAYVSQIIDNYKEEQ